MKFKIRQLTALYWAFTYNILFHTPQQNGLVERRIFKSKEMENGMGIKSLLLGGTRLLIQLNSKSHP
jgi:hypothetical protein